jgi:heat-inducible transcriptional repressor
VQLVPLQAGVVLAVAVLSNGSIVKQIVPCALDVDDARIGTAGAALSSQLSGRPLTDLPALLASSDPDTDHLAGEARDALVDHGSTAESLYVGGTSRIAAEQQSFATVESAGRLLEMLEHQVVVVSLVRDLLDQGLTVRIGSENDIAELRDCAIVLAPYEVEGEMAGTVGVLGPTRMDYRQALAAVEAISQQLGRLLS